MQAFQRAAAVFCMACIGAELVSFFAGQSWAGRCIKATAGLYILAVLLAQLPRLPGKVLTAFSGNTAPAAVSAARLEKAGQQVVVKKAVAALPTGCTAAQKQAVFSLLQQTLGTAPTAAEESAP